MAVILKTTVPQDDGESHASVYQLIRQKIEPTLLLCQRLPKQPDVGFEGPPIVIDLLGTRSLATICALPTLVDELKRLQVY